MDISKQVKQSPAWDTTQLIILISILAKVYTKIIRALYLLRVILEFCIAHFFWHILKAIYCVVYEIRLKFKGQRKSNETKKHSL